MPQHAIDRNKHFPRSIRWCDAEMKGTPLGQRTLANASLVDVKSTRGERPRLLESDAALQQFMSGWCVRDLRALPERIIPLAWTAQTPDRRRTAGSHRSGRQNADF